MAIFAQEVIDRSPTPTSPRKPGFLERIVSVAEKYFDGIEREKMSKEYGRETQQLFDDALVLWAQKTAKEIESTGLSVELFNDLRERPAREKMALIEQLSNRGKTEYFDTYTLFASKKKHQRQ